LASNHKRASLGSQTVERFLFAFPALGAASITIIVQAHRRTSKVPVRRLTMYRCKSSIVNRTDRFPNRTDGNSPDLANEKSVLSEIDSSFAAVRPSISSGAMVGVVLLAIAHLPQRILDNEGAHRRPSKTNCAVWKDDMRQLAAAGQTLGASQWPVEATVYVIAIEQGSHNTGLHEFVRGRFPVNSWRAAPD
jgi:hypothetical protein